MDYVKHLSADWIVGDFITRAKYRFVNHALVAEVVRDVMAIVEQAAAEPVGGQPHIAQQAQTAIEN